MIVVRDKAELREALEPVRGEEHTIGLVPTMGSLHEGHLSLLRAARRRCDVVVMSLFVNPAQFGPGEDFESYPRDEARDHELAEQEGVDLIYTPPVEEVYPEGFATSVEVGGELTEVLCGAPDQRGAGHFRGVTTVVAKLFNSVAPGHRLLRPKGRPAGDRDPTHGPRPRLPGRDRGPADRTRTRRARDELPKRLPERRGAPARRGADPGPAGGRAGRGVGRDGAQVALDAARAELERAGIEPEYLEARDAEGLAPAESLNGRPVLVAVAARVGQARLIDNLVIGG